MSVPWSDCTPSSPRTWMASCSIESNGKRRPSRCRGATAMDPSISERDRGDEVAEEFVERYRPGERPSLKEYTDRFPQWADRIRAVFRALVLMEQARPDPADAAGRHGATSATAIPLERIGDYRILRE